VLSSNIGHLLAHQGEERGGVRVRRRHRRAELAPRPPQRRPARLRREDTPRAAGDRRHRRAVRQHPLGGARVLRPLGLGFGAQHAVRGGQNQTAALGGAGDEGGTQCPDRATRQPVRRARGSQLEALREIGARHGDEVLHRGVGDERPAAHQLLHGCGQLAHQPQAPAHPARARVEPARQLPGRQPAPLVQLAEQPPLLERAPSLAAPHELRQQQRRELRELPHHRVHRVVVQPLERAHPLGAVDENERTRLAAHHHHGTCCPLSANDATSDRSRLPSRRRSAA
jgi:hypothetical protein